MTFVPCGAVTQASVSLVVLVPNFVFVVSRRPLFLKESLFETAQLIWEGAAYFGTQSRLVMWYTVYLSLYGVI